MSRARRLTSARNLALAGLVLFLGACASDAPQDSLEPEKGSVAEDIQNLVSPVFGIAALVFVIVEVGVLVILWKFRNHNDHDDDELPEQVHGHLALELGWTILPALILTVVAVLTVMTIFDIDDRRAAANQEETSIDRIEVIGHQWWWEYKYYLQDDDEATSSEPDIVTANDLVIPAGETVAVDVTSADVIHSFWIPRLNGKMDAVPGRWHPLVLESDAPGTFIGQCTEYCGLSHGYMHQRVVALDQADYEGWLANMQTEAEAPDDPGEDADPESAEAAAARGAESFVTQCSSCHLIEGVNDEEFAEQGEGRGPDGLVAGPAPNLTHLMSRGTFAGGVFNLWEPGEDSQTPTPDWSDIGFDNGGRINEADLKAWIRDAPGQKPMSPDDRRGMLSFEQLPEDQVDDLYEFLITLD